MARNIIFVLQIPVINCCFQQWKNFQNRLTVDKVIAKISTPRFLKHSVKSTLKNKNRSCWYIEKINTEAADATRFTGPDIIIYIETIYRYFRYLEALFTSEPGRLSKSVWIKTSHHRRFQWVDHTHSSLHKPDTARCTGPAAAWRSWSWLAHGLMMCLR